MVLKNMFGGYARRIARDKNQAGREPTRAQFVSRKALRYQLGSNEVFEATGRCGGMEEIQSLDVVFCHDLPIQLEALPSLRFRSSRISELKFDFDWCFEKLGWDISCQRRDP